MSELIIRDEMTGTSWRVWPDPELISSGGIHETGSYLFELRAPNAELAELLIDDNPLEALRSQVPNTARWRWQPGFQSGTVEATLRIPKDNPRRFELITDPDLRKLTRHDFDTMVREILEDTFALFSMSSFRKSIARGVGTKPPAIARLEFLRSRIKELEKVVSDIVRHPRRRLASTETSVPYHRAKRAKGQEILKAFRSGRINSETSSSTRLPNALNGFLPERISIRERRSSLDLVEHRQMGACLRSWSSWLSAVAGVLTRDQKVADADIRREHSKWAFRCRRMSHSLSGMAMEPPFKEAAEAPPILRLSAIFRNDPLYRRFFRLSQDMDLGIAAVFGDFLDMPLARTFDLYELWCFLRLVRAAAEEFGAEKLETTNLFISDARGGVTVAAGAVTVSLEDGWKLCFQKQYREFWIEPGGRGSFSRNMVPDIVIMQDPPMGTGRLIILDSKYRINEGLNAALDSIHTYRDALVHEADSGSMEGIVAAAYLLTPDIPQLIADYRETPMPGRLFHPVYRSNFRFGAITMRPGMTTAEIGLALQMISQDAIA
ncbi:MAG TPA: DUF2357 domain-containing protein [Edaphobacter sp.]|nr:DUF2357 domain-containing protein [Edaphobacter sp.]